MTPTELTALLALPASAREALAGCGGPGWSVRLRDGSASPLATRNSADDPGWAWLPYDATAILDVAAAHGAVDVVLRRASGGWWADAEDVVATSDAPTARLASLRLLAAVSK